MYQALKTFFLTAFLLALGSGVVFSQTASPALAVSNEKAVKWENIGGKNNEFMLSMPAGYLAVSDADYYMGKPSSGAARVEKQIILARIFNGVILFMEYYEGNADNIQKELLEREKLAAGKEEMINGFTVKHFTKNTENRVHRIQHFSIKNRLYVVKTIAQSENDKIVKAFFESVRLINQSTAAAPNAAPGAKSTSLPMLVERAAVADDANAIPESEADRKPIILKNVRPQFTFEMRQNLGGQGKFKLRALFSSTGKITDVEVLQSPSKITEKAVIEAAKQTIFLPAEKGGKPVSVYKMIEYSFESGRL